MHFSRWNGSRQNHSVDYVPLRDPPGWDKGPFPDHSSAFHYRKLGKRIPHVDRPERGGVSRQHDQQADDPAVRDVLQGLPGSVRSLLCNNFPVVMKTWLYIIHASVLVEVIFTSDDVFFKPFLHIRIFNICLLSKFGEGDCSRMDVVSARWVILRLNGGDADTHVEMKVYTDGGSWVLNLKSRENKNTADEALCYL